MKLTSLEELGKEILQALQTCTNCKFCISVCPVYEGWIREAAVGKIFTAYYIVKYSIPVSDELKDILWYCTTCGRCEYICKKLAGGIEIVNLVENARRLLLHKYKLEPVKRHSEVLKDVLTYYNPYYTPNEKRWEWLPIELPSKGEYLYFVGCTAGFRVKSVAKATVEAFKRLDVNLAKFSDEKCCCSVLLRVGFVEEALPIMEENYLNINNSGAKYLVTSCAGCYRSLKKDYPKLIGDFNLEILHSSELAQKLLETGKLKLNSKELKGKRVTYHDPCHLGRHANIYAAPRAILSSIQGIDFIEMPNNKENSACCGCGGGFRSGFTPNSFNIATKRLQEAKDLGVNLLVTCCPFCELQLSEVSRERGFNIEVIDLMELIAKTASK